MKTLILFIIVIPLLTYGNYTGDRILAASQKYGMTDSELNYLIDNTAPDLTQKDPKFGATALIHSCVNNRPNMVRILIEKGGANIDEVDNNGETCLIGASRKGNMEVINILLGLGANKAIVGNLNKSAYDYAVEFGHTEVARLLGGPPKQKISFKTISNLAVNKKSGVAGAPSLASEKYLQDLGKISLIVEAMKPVPGKGDVEKLNEVSKVTGFSNLVKRQIQVRDQEEEKLSIEKENQRAKAKGVMMAKLKAIAAFNNLYLDVKTKNAKEIEAQAASPKMAPAKLSFSDATNQMMSEMDLKLKRKEEEIQKEKELEAQRNAADRIKLIKDLVYAGSAKRDISALKNEPEEKLKEKVEAVKEILDPKESKQVSWVSVQTAKKKINVISAFQSSGQAFPEKIKAINLNREELYKGAVIAAAAMEKQKLAEAAKAEEMERNNFYKLVQEKANVAKFTENLKAKGKVAQEFVPEPVAVEQEKSVKTEQFEKKPSFDEVRGAMTTPDFMVWLLTNRDCQIKRNPNGTFYVIISKLKLSRVVQASRQEAIWFINTKEKPTPPNGGLECKTFCRDPAIYVGNLYNNPRREIFLSNLIIQLGKGPFDSFEIYSSKPGNKVLKVPINECKMAF